MPKPCTRLQANWLPSAQGGAMTANYFSTAPEVAFPAQRALAGLPPNTNPDDVNRLMKRTSVEPDPAWLGLLGDMRLVNMHARLSTALAKAMDTPHTAETRRWLDTSRSFVAAARLALKLLLQGVAACWGEEDSPFSNLPLAALARVTADPGWRAFVARVKAADTQMMAALGRSSDGAVGTSSARAVSSPSDLRPQDPAAPPPQPLLTAAGGAGPSRTRQLAPSPAHLPEDHQPTGAEYTAASAVPTRERPDVRAAFKTIHVPGGGFKEQLRANYDNWVDKDVPALYASLRPKPTVIIKMYSKVGE